MNNRFAAAALACLTAASIAACSPQASSPAAAPSPSATAAAASSSAAAIEPTATASTQPAGISGSVVQTPAPAAASGGPVTSSDEMVDATVQYVLWSLLAGDKKSATAQMTPWYAKITNELTGLGLPNALMEQACEFDPIRLSPEQVGYTHEHMRHTAQTTPGIILTAYRMSCPKEDYVIAAATDPATMKVAETANIHYALQESEYGVPVRVK